MRLFKVVGITLVLLLTAIPILWCASMEDSQNTKKFDILHYHNVGNIWLRVSNYGFFGSGDSDPQWPSLEYPGGSSIDYLYQGALWFGAKKVRRDVANNVYYWKVQDPQPGQEDSIIAKGAPGYDPTIHTERVIDTLVTVGFDGDAGHYEFLPAYNPLENVSLGAQYIMHNPYDQTISSSIREQRRGIDDDGDGLIDEDPPGYEFQFRKSEELPDQLRDFGDDKLSNFITGDPRLAQIEANKNIWFPLGFVDLSVDPTGGLYNFSEPFNDDGDAFVDEDGYPVSEQDYISYYYDYSPFDNGYAGERDWGRSANTIEHVPLNVQIRQMSYQWSFGYIKNLCYIEFDITNMNPADTLFDCCMGIYVDADVGPQAWTGDERSLDDASSYVSGEGYEFAYTYDVDTDEGLTTGYIGARVCTPDPDGELQFECYTWKRGDGPLDEHPLDIPLNDETSNEKYSLLHGQNRDEGKWTSLREEPDTQTEDDQGLDTRFLFAFRGDQKGLTNPENPDNASWNLGPYKTMKIVIAIFPGETLEELKRTAVWAKYIYGEAQDLTTVVDPDTVSHYNPPEPPSYPFMYAKPVDDGDRIQLYWNNRSEFVVDNMTVTDEATGWQVNNPGLDSDFDNYDDLLLEYPDFPIEFSPDVYGFNPNALVNPWTSYRLRHDFQGYMLWGRSGKGSNEYWSLIKKWDKKETDLDIEDYTQFDANDAVVDMGGYQGNDVGLPNSFTTDDPEFEEYKFDQYYMFDKFYKLTRIDSLREKFASDPWYHDGTDIFEVYGIPLYNLKTQDEVLPVVDSTWSKENLALQFKSDYIEDEIYLNLYEEKHIPLPGFSGNNFPVKQVRKERLASRYYTDYIENPPKGIEYYTSVTTYDRGIPTQELEYLESGKDANMKVFFPGAEAKKDMDNIYVVPNPYIGLSKFDGRRENDDKGDKSKRIWFVNLPEKCTIKIFTLAGDLVDEIEHNGASAQDIITVSKAAEQGIQSSGIEPWDVLSKYEQIIASGVYLFSVKDHDSGDIKVGKFVLIK